MKIKNKNLKTFFKLLIVIFGIAYIVKLYIYNNYCINISPSIPKGIYKLEEVKEVKRGDIVYLEIPDNAKPIIWGRNYLPKHITYLIKYIRGVPQDLVEIKNEKIYINREFKGNIQSFDKEGNKLNSYLPKEYILQKDEYILLGTDNNSYDSRYFGVIKKEKILKIAHKIEW